MKDVSMDINPKKKIPKFLFIFVLLIFVMGMTQLSSNENPNNFQIPNTTEQIEIETKIEEISREISKYSIRLPDDITLNYAHEEFIEVIDITDDFSDRIIEDLTIVSVIRCSQSKEDYVIAGCTSDNFYNPDYQKLGIPKPKAFILIKVDRTAMDLYEGDILNIQLYDLKGWKITNIIKNPNYS